MIKKVCMDYKNTNSRNVQSDLIRVVGAIFAISVHTVAYFISEGLWSHMLVGLFFACNPIFFMLSGKYNLKKRFDGCKSILKYYGHIGKKIYLPFLLYCLIIFSYGHKAEKLGVGEFVARFCGDLINQKISGHLWYMYTLFGVLLCVPFISKMVNALSDNELLMLVFIGWLWNFLKIILYFDVFNISAFPFSGWIFSDWILYFILGFAIDRKNIGHIKILMFGGFLAYVITIIQVTYIERHMNVHDLSPINMIFIAALYIFLEQVVIVNCAWIRKIIVLIAKRTYSIYLIHIMILRIVVVYTKKLQINPNVALFGTILLVFIASYIVTLIIDSISEFMIKFLGNCFFRKKQS